MARPTDYTKELGIKICRRIAEGESLKKISEDKGTPCRKTIHSWLLDEDKQEFLHNYKTACNVRTENMFDELEEIADSTLPDETNKARLRVDVRKWYLSKVMPKKYGDKLDMTTDGEKIDGVNIVVRK